MTPYLWANTNDKKAVNVKINIESSHKRAVPGQVITFTVKIENKGSMMVTNLGLKCQLPEIFLLVEGKGSSKFDDKKSDISKGLVRFENLPLVDAGAKLIYKITCEPQEPGIVVFKASAFFDQHVTSICDEKIIVIRTGK